MNAINKLNFLIKNHTISFLDMQESFCLGWKKLSVKIENEIYHLHLDDEYEDLNKKIPELTLCVVLRNLEEYIDSSDFLSWCKSTGINPENSVALTYYQSLSETTTEIETIIGSIKSHISDYDFTLNSGDAQKLRRKI